MMHALAVLKSRVVDITGGGFVASESNYMRRRKQRHQSVVRNYSSGSGSLEQSCGSSGGSFICSAIGSRSARAIQP